MRYNNKQQALITLAIILAIVIVVNIIGSKLHGSIDLTQEKRFTITTPTKQLLKQLPSPVNVRILLKSGLPSNFEKLRTATTDLLATCKDISGNKVFYSYENPIADKSDKEKETIYQNFINKGITPVKLNAQINSKQKVEEQVIFPYALVSANGGEVAVSMLESHTGMGPRAITNYSESMLEYKFAQAIQSLYKTGKDKVAYLMGHGEALGGSTYDALNTLGSVYDVDTFGLDQVIDISPTYKAVIICRPTATFNDKDKFKLDQYVMGGGNLFLLIDPCDMQLDTLQQSPNYSVIAYNLGLDDLLFKYGARLNTNLVEDLESNPIPVVVGMNNDVPQTELLKWVYFPVFTPIAQHPIVYNMDAIAGKFASTIDIIDNPEIQKTTLLNTSSKSRVLGVPLIVSLNSLRFQLKPELFNKKHLPIAVLLQGKFKSLYAGMGSKFISVYQDSLGKKYRTQCEQEGKIIVCSDADVFFNEFSPSKGPSELGFYKFTGDRFANKQFVLNCIEYLTNPNNLLAARNKNIKLRLLDSDKVSKKRTKWQITNVLVPIALCLFIGSGYWFFRKKKYEQVN
jgi:ABC-2 type transport system permease protein